MNIYSRKFHPWKDKSEKVRGKLWGKSTAPGGKTPGKIVQDGEKISRKHSRVKKDYLGGRTADRYNK